MAEFLTRKATASAIEKIIKNAARELYLVSPYLQISDDYTNRLKNAASRGVTITIVCRKKTLSDAKKNQLSRIANTRVYDCENLHAKCYFNERSMVITFMNLYEYSENKNKEIGILIEASGTADDQKLYAEARQEIIFFMEHKIKPMTPARRDHPVKNGKCIRCATPRSVNPDYPYCGNCYAIWKKYKNANYPENYCNRCGRNYKTSLNKPFCIHCHSLSMSA